MGGGAAVDNLEKWEPRFERDGAWAVAVGDVFEGWSCQGLGVCDGSVGV